MRRIKLLLGVVAAMTMLVVVSAPAMADDFGRDCYPFCNDHQGFNDHDLFINDLDDDFKDDFDDDIDDFFDKCVFVGYDGDEAIFVCEVDF